ncbi:hypothetical protein QBC36DRAFT_312120 [Triangularia setosa]|uniref:DUF7357 domain-containing protein n=1 Tax=Triangularia setosa TaxID=2587417 RepID=A0AAN6W891_9PEZI|nr:hypothetical protein QBC36DRAFT_312120 [Podospora setosa]
MRLRLVVRRHALPDARIVFSCKTEDEPTIAGLLEQVNEIIPLESNEWGLEDYIVELRQKDTGAAYDCLHFQQVADVLKDDEEVYIRPLVTDDRRKRRLSGRDQITNDGRHLLDGIPFGRPRLRAAYSRPVVDIPPLKRPRLTYYPHDEGDDDDGQQLMITESGERGGKQARRAGSVRFSAPYDADLDEDAQDDDYAGQNANQDESDMEPIDEDDMGEDSSDQDSHDDVDLDEDDESDLEAELRDLQDDVESQEGARNTTAVEEHTTHRTGKAKEVEAPIDSQGRGIKRFRDNDELDGSDAESVASVVKHYDQHGFPSGSILNGTASRHMVEEMRKKGASVNLPVHTKFEDDGSDESDALDEDVNDASHHSSSEETGASDSDSDSDSDSGPEVASSKVYPSLPGYAEHDPSDSNSDSDNSRGSSEDGNDDGALTAASTKPSDQLQDVEEEDDNSGGNGDNDDSSEGSSDSKSDGDGDSDEGANAIGDHETDDDDDSNTPDAEEDSGEDSEDKNNSDLAENSSNEDFDGHLNGDSSSDSSDDDSSSASDDSSQGVSSSDEDSPSENGSSSDDESSSDDDTSVDKEHAVPEPKKAASSPIKPPQVTPAAHVEGAGIVRPGAGKPSTRKRNARRRALAQAKKAATRAETSVESTPTASSIAMTEADSAELVNIASIIAAKKAEMLQRIGTLTGMIVEELKGDASSQQASTNDAATAAVASSQLPETPATAHIETKEAPHDTEEDPDAWRAKINYRAVECCQEGMLLSEPPFPFIQRWDPQQKYQHGGRKKRKQRNQDDYQYQHEEAPRTKKRRSHAGDMEEYSYGGRESYYHDESMAHGDITLNYDDEPREQPEQRVSEVREEGEEEDLPPLPADPSTLPVLQPGSAAPGMILTWQQLLMSKATNWTPQVSRLTGVIVNLETDGALRIRLAKRDQNLDRNEKVYDDEGNRVYDKFELPGMDDEDEEEEEGYRTLDLSEMMESRVLQYPSQIVPGTPLVQKPSLSHSASSLKKTTSAQTSATLGHEGSEQSADETSQMDINTQTLEESMIPESCVRNDSSEHQDGQVMSVEDISMTGDRRHETSQLINEAGFHKEVDPSITNDALSNRSSNSPSRQLAKMSHDVLSRPFESSQPQGDMRSRPASRGTSNGVDSQRNLLEPFNGFSDAISLPSSEHQVEYPKLGLPPSEVGSVQSGRQVNLDFSIDLTDSSFNALEDDSANRERMKAGEVEEGEEEDVPTPRPSRPALAVSESSSSDDSLPSVSELCTRPSTNNSSGVPARVPAQVDVIQGAKSRTSKTTADAEYEEAMRRLNNMEDNSEYSNSDDKDSDSDSYLDSNESDFGRGPSKLARKLIEKPIEKPSPRKSQHGRQSSLAKIRMEPVSSSQFGTSRLRSAAGSSPVQIPEGSQAVSLLSSSPEPAVEEQYAEDDIDETFKDSQDSDWPKGGNWVMKERTTAAARRVGLSRRSMSVPASSLGPARGEGVDSQKNCELIAAVERQQSGLGQSEEEDSRWDILQVKD